MPQATVAKRSVAQVLYDWNNEKQVRSLSRFMWEYLQEEMNRGHIVDANTLQDAIDSWASQHGAD